MKKNLPLLVCILLFLAGCSAIDRMIGGYAVPTNVTIEGVTYCNGFYGDLYPVFEQVGDIGSETLQEGMISIGKQEKLFLFNLNYLALFH